MGAIFHCNPDRPFRETPDLYLCFWGKEKCAPQHSFGPGVRDLYKIHFIHSGEGIVRSEGKTFTLTAGQAFILYPDRVIFYQADEINPWTYSWIGFYGDQVDSILNRTGVSPQNPVFSMDTRLMPKLYDLLNEAGEHATTRDLRLHALLNEALSVMVELAPSSECGILGSGARNSYIHSCLEFLHSHYSDEVSVGQLAQVVGLDRKYLSAIFKEATGFPPQQYLLRYRMERACELLKKGKFTVGEIARSVGYRDALLFSKMFKKTVGVSPTEYRIQ
ncbi:AraC family transcriptional regulator [Paenibacillus puldeungensis]|uniref:AraC family transcriptional regulator n=1 Tax=Paenibacillus puldeungensis TaxID=696536 RepID=A0ABW3S0H5_9BACL